MEGKEPDTCRGEGLCSQSVPSSPEHASFLPTQLKPWTRGATFINRACWLPSGGRSCQGLGLNPASIPSQLSDLGQGPSLRKRRLVHLPGTYQESQSERVKGLAWCLPQATLAQTANLARRGLIIDPRGHSSAPCDSGQGQGNLGHPPKKGSPWGQSHGLCPQAGSLPVLSQLRRTWPTGGSTGQQRGRGKRSQAGLTNEEPQGSASVSLSAKRA